MRLSVLFLTSVFTAAAAAAAEPVSGIAAHVQKLQSIVAKIEVRPAEPVGRPDADHAEPVGKPAVDPAEPVSLRELQASTTQLAASVEGLRRAYQKAESKKGLELAGAMTLAASELQKEVAAYGSARDTRTSQRAVGAIRTLLVTIDKLRKEVDPCCNVFTAASKDAAAETCRKQAAAQRMKSCEAREAGARATSLFTCVCN